jgi:hypothetical protein
VVLRWCHHQHRHQGSATIASIQAWPSRPSYVPVQVHPSKRVLPLLIRAQVCRGLPAKVLLMIDYGRGILAACVFKSHDGTEWYRVPSCPSLETRVFEALLILTLFYWPFEQKRTGIRTGWTVDTKRGLSDACTPWTRLCSSREKITGLEK